jgi:hypothetical protein
LVFLGQEQVKVVSRQSTAYSEPLSLVISEISEQDSQPLASGWMAHILDLLQSADSRKQQTATGLDLGSKRELAGS